MVDEIGRRVVEIIAGILGPAVGTIEISTSMDDVKEWDSLRHVSIIKTLEAEFGVLFPEEDMFDLVSVQSFVEEIAKLKGL